MGTKKTAKSKEKEIGFFRKPNFILGVIIGLAFILYGNTISNHYSLDDGFVTNNNPVIQKGIKAIPEIFTSLYSTIEHQQFGYRPIVKATFAIEFQFFGQNPHVSHFFNIILYALLCIMIFLTLKKLFKKHDPLFSLAITLIYMAHPVHAEVVASLKNRDEILSLLGSISAVYFLILYTEKSKINYLASSLFFYLFAYLSKSNALVFLAIFPLVLYFFSASSIKKIITLSIAFGIVFIIAQFAPKLFLPQAIRDIVWFENPLFFESDKIVVISTGLYSLLIYLKLLVWPHPLLFYYGFDAIPIVKWDNLLVLFSLLFHIFILGYAIMKLRKKHIISFAILLYLISISMYSNILQPVMGIVAERYLLMPSLAFSMVVVFYVSIYLKANFETGNIPSAVLRKFFGIIVLLLIPYAARTIARNADWHDSLTLYQNDINYLDNSVKANDIIATCLLDEVYNQYNKTGDAFAVKRKLEQSLKYYKRTLQLYDKNPKALHNVGGIYLYFYKDPDEALTYFNKAAGFDSLNFKIYFNMAQCYELKNSNEKAKYYYTRAIKLNPEFIDGYTGLANMYNKTGDFNKAVRLNECIMKIDSASDIPYANIGYYFICKYDTANAVSYWEKAFSRNSNNYQRAISLSNYFRKKGETSKADYYYNKAMAIK